MIYVFECDPCGLTRQLDSKPFQVPEQPLCVCGKVMDRVYGCEIDTSGCKDHDDIPPQLQVQRRNPVNAERLEAAYQRDIQQKRSMAQAGGNSGSIRMSHSVPAELYHGKIRQTGDKNYWNDPKNLSRHKSTRI